MTVLVRIIAVIFIGTTASLSAVAQDDLDSVSRRLNELEAEQAKSQAVIDELRAVIDTMNKQAEDDRLARQSVPTAEPAPTVATLPDGEHEIAPAGKNTIFSELRGESKFVMSSDDGDFTLAIDGLIATRWEYNHRDDIGDGTSGHQSGFEGIGTRLNFRGSLYDDLGYWVRFNADEFSSDPFIDAAILIWYINEDTTLVGGQFPSTLTRDQGIPLDQLMVLESSATNYTFDPFGFKGVMVGHHTPRVIYRGIIHDGYRSFNNSYDTQPSAEWAVAGQVIGMLVGDKSDWPRFDDFTSRPGSGGFAWTLNAAFTVQDGGSDLAPDLSSSDDVFLGVLESSMEGDGWNAYATGYYRETQGPSTGGLNMTDTGFVIHGGLWVAKHFEVYSRFDITMPDDDRPVENEDFRTLMGGVNFYPFPHTNNIKIGTELLYMFDAEADSIVTPNTFNSVKASPADDQWVMRVQAHILW